MAENMSTEGNASSSIHTGDFGISPTFLSLIAGVAVIVLLISRWSTPDLDDREPPALKPRFPVIGHLIGLLWYQGQYFKVLYKKGLPIATLPILNGKLYAIWDPALVQSASRNKDLSFEPFAVEFSQKDLGLGNDVAKLLRETDLVPDFFGVIHPALNGAHLHRMNANALKYVSAELDRIGGGVGDEGGLDVPNLFAWLRRVMTLATTEGLYGVENPVMKDLSLIDDLWTFESGVPMFILDILPQYTARKAFQVRARLQAGLSRFYMARHDHNDDVAQIVKARADVLRRYGIPDREIGTFKLGLLHVGTANTIPVFFWFLAHVFSRPELVERLREEVLEASQRKEDEAIIDITIFEKECPLLVSCYRESMRLSSRVIGNRRVTKDTTISDGKGRSYMLKSGGEAPASFLPERFLAVENGGSKEAGDEKMKRAANIPFGGGRHLCPGRNFAFAENLGFVSALLLGFEVKSLNGNVGELQVPEAMACTLADGTPKPERNGEGFGVRIVRREGWEKAKFRFVC
ncbi:prostacyclin synthase [Colletotrichum asianum]|uniref:Prostacyclin synthase n=1 Tax=Colletotrichum asianum TaxID=702518 RepID=A0A8H3ZSG1_9PEZI|nr:prostacyclin synthase [Colletotrichum asianum]